MNASSDPRTEAAATVAELTHERIASTAELIRPWIRRSPIIRLDLTDLGLPSGQLVLKLEHLQHTGSFKARGAFANLLLRSIPEAGVVAASGGNHGAAVAYAAQRLGVAATIFVPVVSSSAKTDRIRSYGADLVVTGQTYSDALAASQEWSSSTKALQIHAFDQVETMLGTATLAVELQEQAPDISVVAAAVGGGGLLAGIAASYQRSIRVVGVEPRKSPTLNDALAAGGPTDSATGGIAIDSLAPRRVGERTFAVITAHAGEVLLVEDDEIRQAQRLLWERLRLVAEPGGCAALAAVTSGRLEPAPGETVAVVISGANTSGVSFASV